MFKPNSDALNMQKGVWPTAAVVGKVPWTLFAAFILHWYCVFYFIYHMYLCFISFSRTLLNRSILPAKIKVASHSQTIQNQLPLEIKARGFRVNVFFLFFHTLKKCSNHNNVSQDTFSQNETGCFTYGTWKQDKLGAWRMIGITPSCEQGVWEFWNRM